MDETAGKQVLEQVLNHALAFDTFHPGESLADDGYSIMPPRLYYPRVLCANGCRLETRISEDLEFSGDLLLLNAYPLFKNSFVGLN